MKHATAGGVASAGSLLATRLSISSHVCFVYPVELCDVDRFSMVTCIIGTLYFDVPSVQATRRSTERFPAVSAFRPDTNADHNNNNIYIYIYICIYTYSSEGASILGSEGEYGLAYAET